MTDIAALESRLNNFDHAERDDALAALARLVANEEVHPPLPGRKVNLHLHSFYSYNAEGLSPSGLAWRALREGLSVVGLVDFDVLDGLEEFFAAGRTLGLRCTVGIETRVFIPEFAEREINSPGEPGISYHMGSGLWSDSFPDESTQRFAAMLRDNAQQRNGAVTAAVNDALDPVRLDYEADVLPLSPAGTPTERHLCEAYQAKAEAVFPDPAERAAFWAGKLDTPADEIAAILNKPAKLQGLLRSKMMKAGGPGYQTPEPEKFPTLVEMNEFVLAMGGIPTLTWLDGTSEGEQAIEELLDLQMASGVAAVNIIPDRNWNIADEKTKQRKLDELYRFVTLADERDLPISVGTEMNAPGTKFVDTFEAPELAPVRDSFLRGAYILHGHTVAMQTDGKGYLSEWAAETFETTAEKNAHFYHLGKNVLRD